MQLQTVANSHYFPYNFITKIEQNASLHTTRKHGIFLLTNLVKKIPNLNKRRENHSMILDKLISTCPLLLGWLFLLAKYGPFDWSF
jgi:hypothetical protein